ncbi:hypothetical protein [Brevundimonas sp. R86498]|uniref:hypothetical protein n=1 Tax=Brevundimonas sp. R86498 TaxID=3093845 RepID=UPI0037CC9D26
MAFGGLLFGFFWVGAISGLKVMEAELQFALAGLAGVAAVSVLILAYNLVAVPYRVAKGARLALEGKLEVANARIASLSASLAKMEEARPIFQAWIDAATFGGSDGSGNYPVVVMLRISNRGSIQSAAVDWTMGSGGPEDGLRAYLTALDRPLQFDTPSGPGRLDPQDLIFRKTATPIQQGQVVGGWLIGHFAPREDDISGVWVQFSDTFGNIYRIAAERDAGQQNAELQFSPFYAVSKTQISPE